MTKISIQSSGAGICEAAGFPQVGPTNGACTPATLNKTATAIDFHFSVLRCQYAEACRRRDSVQSNIHWTDQISTGGAYLFRHLLRVSAWTKDSLFAPIHTIRKLSDILPRCDGVDLISFDVFDTLLHRTIEPPDLLKRHAADYASEVFSARGYPVSSELFMYLRNESEARLRRQSQRGGGDTECKLSDIIFEVLYRLFDTEIAKLETTNLVEHEVELEFQHLRVAKGASELLNVLKSQGKRVIVTSDTYLELSHLRRIFIGLDLSQYIDEIYLSSEYGLGKYSGRLFQRILEKEQADPSKVVHVGDTYESDIRGAVKARIPAVFLLDFANLRRRRHLARSAAKDVPQNPEDLPSIGNFPTELEQPKNLLKENGELYGIGRDILGPAFTLFVLEAIQEAYRIGASDVYYLAREGFLMRRLHDILVGKMHRLFGNRPTLTHRYLYVSRLATSLPAIHNMGERELHFALYRDRAATLNECIKAFGLTAAKFSDMAVDFQERDGRAKARLFANATFAERVNALASVERRKLRRYLSQERFFQKHEVKMLVDIGWNATIQSNLTRAFERDPDFPLVVGLYFGRKYLHEDYLVSSRSLYMPGLFFDQKRRVPAEHAIGHCLELFELAAAAPHGATIGYKETDMGIEPVCSDFDAKISQEQQRLQSGIVDYAVEFAKEHFDQGLGFSVLRRRAIERLRRLVLEPTVQEAAALRSLHHSLDWGSKKTRPLIARNMSPLLVLSPRRFVASLQECYWLEGSLRLTRLPGALLTLSLVRRVTRIRLIARRLWSACSNFFRGSVASPIKS